MNYPDLAKASHCCPVCTPEDFTVYREALEVPPLGAKQSESPKPRLYTADEIKPFVAVIEYAASPAPENNVKVWCEKFFGVQEKLEEAIQYARKLGL